MEIEKKSDDTPLIKSIYTDVMKTTINKDIKDLSKSLGKRRAEDIKKWRCEDEHSWRSLANVFVEKHKEYADENNIISGNQVSGIILSEAAMLKLKETWE